MLRPWHDPHAFIAEHQLARAVRRHRALRVVPPRPGPHRGLSDVALLDEENTHEVGVTAAKTKGIYAIGSSSADGLYICGHELPSHASLDCSLFRLQRLVLAEPGLVTLRRG
jgi:hypothetical protein